MLLAHKVDYCELMENGDTALHKAAANGHSEVVQILLPNFVKCGLLNHKNNDSQTPLFAAVCHGHADVVKALAAGGADAGITDSNQETPLLRAVAHQDWPVIQALLGSGAELGPYNSTHLLEWAIEREQWAAIAILLQRPDAGLLPDTLGRLLCQAAREGKASVVTRLVEAPLNAAAHNSDDNGQLAPLVCAAQGGHVQVVNILLQHGVEVNQKDREGKTALAHAIEAGQDEIATVLLGVPEVDTSWKDLESTTLLALASQRGMVSTVDRLLHLDAIEPNAINENGHTALSLAAAQGHVNIVGVLLRNARVSIKPNGAQNPLFCAVRANKPRVITLFRRDDVENLITDRDEIGRSPLSVACELGGLESVEYLLGSKGSVDPDLADVDGKTPLCWAAENGHGDVVENLIQYAADVNVRTNAMSREGWRPLHYAAVSGSSTVVKTLLVHTNANAAADDGTTPLIAALQAAVPHVKDVLDQLLLSDSISLYEQVQKGNDDMVRCLLAAGYNVNKKYRCGGTALHAVVTSEGQEPVEMATALLAANPKPDLTIKNNDDLTPVRLALQKSRRPLVELFLASSASLTRNISADDWFLAYGDNNRCTIRVKEGAGAGAQVEALSKEDLLVHVRDLPHFHPPGLRQWL
jgi:ankyrin repeat protein